MLFIPSRAPFFPAGIEAQDDERAVEQHPHGHRRATGTPNRLKISFMFYRICRSLYDPCTAIRPIHLPTLGLDIHIFVTRPCGSRPTLHSGCSVYILFSLGHTGFFSFCLSSSTSLHFFSFLERKSFYIVCRPSQSNHVLLILSIPHTSHPMLFFYIIISCIISLSKDSLHQFNAFVALPVNILGECVRASCQ